MNGKERSLAVFRGQEPDRVLMYVTVISEVVDGLPQVADIPMYHCDDFFDTWQRRSNDYLVRGISEKFIKERMKEWWGCGSR